MVTPLLMSDRSSALGFHGDGARTTTRVFWRDVSGSWRIPGSMFSRDWRLCRLRGGCSLAACSASTLLQRPCTNGEIPRQLGQDPLCPHVGPGAEEQRRKGIGASTVLSASPEGSRAARTPAAVCTARRRRWHNR